MRTRRRGVFLQTAGCRCPMLSGMASHAPTAATLARWRERMLESMLPRHCLLCGQASADSPLCAGCRGDLPRLSLACTSCALPLPPAAAGGSAAEFRCGKCVIRPPPWDRAVAALRYEFPADDLVCRFKFGRDLCAGAALADELRAVLQGVEGPHPDAIVPVPLHRSRFLARTFNQAELLARALGQALGLPVQARLLLRRRRTNAQSGLDASARLRNVRGAFELRRRTAREPMPPHVALVDDVLTTGVTLAECTRVLKRGGARRVSVWVAARAP